MIGLFWFQPFVDGMLHNVSDTNSSLRGESFEEPVALDVNSEKNQLLGGWGDAYYLHSIAAEGLPGISSWSLSTPERVRAALCASSREL